MTETPLTSDEWEHGHLIYGLRKPRKTAMRSDPFFKNINLDGKWPVIDLYEPFCFGNSPERAKPFQLQQDKFINSLRRHEKYRFAVDPEQQEAIFTEQESFYRAVMHKVKGGLNWVKEEKNKAYFILDGIDMDKVVAKEPSATGVELRWIYRNWHDPAVKASVHFRKNGGPADPPWVTDAETWARYKPKSAAARATSRVERADLTEKSEDFFKLFADFF